MTEKDKNLMIKIVVGVVLFLAAFLALDLLGQFLAYFLVKAALAAIITWAVISIGEKIGLPGFSAKKSGKKK
ncbi:MAG: hypothetical protein FWE50_01640 [Alphaproteobacteria bacterium]|nr:hypothetical protein [Alphaproteobacteria bacterium]